MIGLGRLRGVGLGQTARMYSHFIVYFPVTNMDPVLWASSDPALKLHMVYEESMPFPGQHVFGTESDPNTVVVLLRQDQRVGWAELIRQDPIDKEGVIPAMNVPPGLPVEPARPEPGKPALQLPGYIPKQPGSNGGKLTWDEKAAAAVGPVLVKMEEPACLPWWLLLVGAYLISRR